MGLDRLIGVVLQLGFIWGTALSTHHEPTDLDPGAAQFFLQLPTQPDPNPTFATPSPPSPPKPQPTATITQMTFQPSQPSVQFSPLSVSSVSTPSPGPIFDGRFNSPVPVVMQPSSVAFDNPAKMKSFFELPIPFTRDDPKPFRQPLMTQVPVTEEDFYLQTVSPPKVVPFQHNVDYRSTPSPLSRGETAADAIDEVDSGQETHIFYY